MPGEARTTAQSVAAPAVVGSFILQSNVCEFERIRSNDLGCLGLLSWR